jgi:hypothetical protein
MISQMINFPNFYVYDIDELRKNSLTSLQFELLPNNPKGIYR